MATLPTIDDIAKDLALNSGETTPESNSTDSSNVRKNFKKNVLILTKLAKELKEKAETCTQNDMIPNKKELQYINEMNDLMIRELQNIQKSLNLKV